jgi:hypothetical protein
MINYWLEKINNREAIERINRMLAEAREKDKERDQDQPWEPDL